jgi:hypothetical protein
MGGGYHGPPLTTTLDRRNIGAAGAGGGLLAAIVGPARRLQGPTSQRRIAMPVRRTTHRSSKGTKLYAVRDSKGRFKDIQTYKRAHGMDIKRGSKAEKAAKSRKAK